MKTRSFAVVGAAIATAFGALAARAAFNVSFTDYAVGEALSDKGATGGGWLPLPAEVVATNVLKGAEKAMCVCAPEADSSVTFTNTASIAVQKARYDFRASFDFADDVSETSVDAAACGFTMGRDSSGALAFSGAAGGRWHTLSAAGVTPELDTLYDLRLETQEIGEATYVSYSIKSGEAYVTLSGPDGATLFLTTRKTGEAFSQVAFTGSGALAGFSGAIGEGASIPSAEWKGSSGGSWTDAANWSGAAVPTSGYVRVNGKMKLTNGSASATVSNFVAVVGADGNLTLKAGIIATPLSLDLTSIDNRPRAGKAFSLTVGSFMGLTPNVSCAWFRATPKKIYESDPVSETTAYTFATSDYSHWFKVNAEGPLGTTLAKEFYFSKLPVLYLTTDDGETPTAAKETHTGQIVTQCGETKWKEKQMFSGAMEIKVRGNSTKGYAKKPWKIKLDKKTNMFGLSGDEKNKHWVLLANYNDESQMRNKLAYDFANEIGSLGMKSTWVECILNGAWQGCYQFCEHIRIATERVNVFDWDGYSEDQGHTAEDFSWVDPATEDITGGYLFESSHEYDELTKFTVTSGTLTLKTMLNSPEYLYTSSAMTNWCATFIQNYCDAVTSATGYSTEDKHWTAYADNDSMVAYFLVMEMFGNNDSSYKSRYFYKDRGQKMKFGPVWDFDWGVGNDVVLGSDDATGWKTLGNNASIFREWADDPWFCTRLWTAYHKKARAAFAAIFAAGGPMDAYKAELLEAGAANDGTWYRKRGFATEVEHLRTFLSNRLAWLDKQFASVATLVTSLKKTTSSSPYTPATAMLPLAFANAPTNVLAQGKALHLSFAVGDSAVAKADVFVNGLRVEKGLAVADGKLETVIPAASLTEGKGDPNCVAIVAYNAAGTLKGRNFALVTLTDFTAEDATPETTDESGAKVPSVPHEWVCKEVASIPGCENLSAATPEEFALAVRTTPSPTGKATPLWHDYVAGTNPDPTAPSNTEFTVTSITIDASGVPTITYNPDLGTRRTYTTMGKVNLTDETWLSPGDADYKNAKFFRVKVELNK